MAVCIEKLWLTSPEFAARYQLPEALARQLAHTEQIPGHWIGKQYRFNAHRCEQMYESGELDRLINEFR